MPAPYGLNSSTNPWRCVLQAPGSSVGQTGDWMIVATQNCKVIGNNKCQSWKSAAEAYCGNYDGTPSDPTGANSWLTEGRRPQRSARHQPLHHPLSGAQERVGLEGSQIPILGFASFYVMGWTGQRRPSNDPCPDPTSRAWRTSPAAQGHRAGRLRRGRPVRARPGRRERGLLPRTC